MSGTVVPSKHRDSSIASATTSTKAEYPLVFWENNDGDEYSASLHSKKKTKTVQAKTA